MKIQKYQNGYSFGVPTWPGKMLTRDINGNWVQLDTATGRQTSVGPQQGTIQSNAEHTKKYAKQQIKQIQRAAQGRKEQQQRVASGKSIIVRGKEVPVKPAAELYAENQDKAILDKSHQESEQAYQQQRINNAQQFTTKALGEFANRFMPSTIARAAYDAATGDKSFIGSMVEGNKGLGNPTANLAFDFLVPYGISKGFQLAGKGFNFAGKFKPNKPLLKSNSVDSRSAFRRTVAYDNEEPSLIPNFEDNWLQLWSERSGQKYTFTNRYIKRQFGKAKQDLLSYIKGDEFKQRVMNSQQFTEEEYPILIKELEKLVKGSKYIGRSPEYGATNFPNYSTVINKDKSGNFYTVSQHTGSSRIRVSDHKSPTQLRSDLWHELIHSIGGHNKNLIEKNPLVARLRAYNENITPTELSPAMKLAQDKNLLRNEMQYYNPNKSPKTIEGWLDKEINDRNWYDKEIIKKPEETRSRMASTLDRFRQLGYNTKELVSNPQKFKDWIAEIQKKRIYMPYDTQHLLASYDIDALANYASKMLTTTGGVYLGSKIFNTNSNFKTR